MKYIVIDRCKYDEWTKEFDNKEEAIKEAVWEWEHMTTNDQKSRVSFYVLESVNPDEDAEDHFDGEIVWEA